MYTDTTKKKDELEVAPTDIKEITDTHVAVVGLGYVGLPLALATKNKGYLVQGYDIDAQKILDIRSGNATYLSEEELDYLKQEGLEVGASESTLVDADIYIICVPTPVAENLEPDLVPLIEASRAVARHVKPGALVIVESTVSPGVCESESLALIEEITGLRGEEQFYFAHCPERINPGDTTWKLASIPRVIAGSGPESLRRATAFYESVIDAKVHPMNSIKEAEAVKMVENAFRDINIAFVNELAMAFNKTGIDLTNVLEGASTKPFGFVPFAPGCGVGGHCIPVDPYYLIRYGRENGFEHKFLLTAREINNTMPGYTVELLKDSLVGTGKTLKGSTIALLGLSYKKDVGDLRESPALAIQELLIQEGAFVNTFDPHIPDKSTVATLEEALERADAVVIATDHEEFRALTPETFHTYEIPILIDGRNCLDKEQFTESGITYAGIGR